MSGGNRGLMPVFGKRIQPKEMLREPGRTNPRSGRNGQLRVVKVR
jgi:hypothetical protein